MIRPVPVVIATLLVAAGCAPSQHPATSGPTFPARPAEVETATVDPCGMFTHEQQRALNLRRSFPRRATVNGEPSPGCVWLGSGGLGYNTQTVPIGAEIAAADPSATIIVINGFGAVRETVREGTGGVPTCQITIDAAPRQSVRVQAQADRPGRTEDEMCRLATDAASMVMTTVVQSTG